MKSILEILVAAVVTVASIAAVPFAMALVMMPDAENRRKDMPQLEYRK